jgi:hypothetical protein
VIVVLSLVSSEAPSRVHPFLRFVPSPTRCLVLDTVTDANTGTPIISYSFCNSSVPAAGSIKMGLYRAVPSDTVNSDATAYVGDWAFSRSVPSRLRSVQEVPADSCPARIVLNRVGWTSAAMDDRGRTMHIIV